MRTASCLVTPWPEDDGLFPGLAGCFARPLARASLVLVWALLCDILISLSVATASASSPPKPRTGNTAGGAGSVRAHGPHDAATVTLCWRQKASHFWIMLLLVSGPIDHGRIMHHAPPSCLRSAPTGAMQSVCSSSAKPDIARTRHLLSWADLQLRDAKTKTPHCLDFLRKIEGAISMRRERTLLLHTFFTRSVNLRRQ